MGERQRTGRRKRTPNYIKVPTSHACDDIERIHRCLDYENQPAMSTPSPLIVVVVEGASVVVETGSPATNRLSSDILLLIVWRNRSSAGVIRPVNERLLL